MKVGIIGLGRMGGGIAANILRAGHEVLVWNRSAHAFAPLLDLGARAAADPIEALQGDVLISMLANENAYAAVGLNGPILARAAKSLVHVNTATVSIDHALGLRGVTAKPAFPTSRRGCLAEQTPQQQAS